MKLSAAEQVEAFRLRRLMKLADRLQRRRARAATQTAPKHMPIIATRRVGKSEHPRRPSYCFHTAYARYPDRMAVDAAIARGEVP